MIKIICGEFGWNDGKGIVVKTVKDEPFNAPADVEKRLVAQGIAKLVDNDAETNPIDGPCYDESTSFEALKEIAIRLGATDEDLKGKRSKAELRTLIDKLLTPEDNSEDENNDNESEDEVGDENSKDEGDGDSEDDAPDLTGDDGVVD